MLDPQAQALLHVLLAKGIPPIHTVTPREARDSYRLRRALTQPDPPPVHVLREHLVPRGQEKLKVREYRPSGVAPGPHLPALVYLHGGGWTIGDLDTHDVLCRTLCNGARCVVLSVDYRLAPEVAFPGAYEDTVAAFQWAAENCDRLGIDGRRIAIGGDSAGGNLAAAACLGLLGESMQPVFQLLIYPATDQRAAAPSHQSNGQGYLLTRDSILWFRRQYLPKEVDYLDWRASPLLANSLVGLPPALVLTAGFDPLRDEGLQYADALSSAGVLAEYVCFERQIHGFISMGRVVREANTAVDLCAAALRRAFA
jgi:acetyl esterase